MKVNFWLLDINHRIDKTTGASELWLWGIDLVGKRVLIIDRKFADYFYAIIQEGFDASKIAKAIINVYFPAIVKVEVAERRFFGKPVQTIKVYCKAATEKGHIAQQLRSLEGIKDCLEDDIRVDMHYLLDNNVVPCLWHEIEANEDENVSGFRVAKVYSANSPPKQKDSSVLPPLRILSFSLICYSREGSPKPERNPVSIISIAASNGDERQFIVDENKNDNLVIGDFIRYIKQFDPDIIASYGSNTVDWKYLRERSHTLGMQLDISRVSSEPHSSIYGHVSIIGLVNIDLADFTDVFPEVKVKTLWNFADHLGVKKDAQRIVESVEFANYWDDRQKRKDLKNFGLDSALKVYGIVTLLLDFSIHLAILTSLPLDYVMTAAVGFRVEWFLIKQAQKIGELIPKREVQSYRSYAGGLVLSPKKGVHQNIAVLDFKSMYPNIMITYNISPDTYIAPDESEPVKGVYEAPEVKHKFRKEPAGFYKEALKNLIDVRNNIRQKMGSLNPKISEYHVLDARQKAVKIITNAIYGYAGWIGAKWYIKPVAEAASAWGRHIILTSTRMAEKAGLLVIYGDTDSIFVNNDENKIFQLQKQIKRKLMLDTEVTVVYKRILFTEAKKRYAGLRKDGSLDIVGLEVIRGDWTEVAKKVQEHVLEIIMKEQSPKIAVDYVRSVIRALKHKKIPLRELVIWKTLTKSPESYAIKAPHVEAAKILKGKGWRLTRGDKIGYLVLKGKGRLYKRAKPYTFTKYDEIDLDYYISNQVLPAVVRILAYFNVTTAELLREIKETEEAISLMDYV